MGLIVHILIVLLSLPCTLPTPILCTQSYSLPAHIATITHACQSLLAVKYGNATSVDWHMVKPGIPEFCAEFRMKILNALHVVKLLNGCVRLAS